MKFKTVYIHKSDFIEKSAAKAEHKGEETAKPFLSLFRGLEDKYIIFIHIHMTESVAVAIGISYITNA